MMTTTERLAAEIADCIACARRENYGGTDEAYELTHQDCESIVEALGFKPTREHWAVAGYPHMPAQYCAEEA